MWGKLGFIPAIICLLMTYQRFVKKRGKLQLPGILNVRIKTEEILYSRQWSLMFVGKPRESKKKCLMTKRLGVLVQYHWFLGRRRSKRFTKKLTTKGIEYLEQNQIFKPQYL